MAAQKSGNKPKALEIQAQIARIMRTSKGQFAQKGGMAEPIR